MTEQPTKSSSEVKRISNPVIKPETGAENGQVVSQALEQPNTELLIVKTIQGLTTCINNELEKLDVLTADMPMNECKLLIIQALANIDSFVKTTLFELQKAFE